eukprot:6909735-Lingulodinium_polyedra.AAC.1
MQGVLSFLSTSMHTWRTKTDVPGCNVDARFRSRLCGCVLGSALSSGPPPRRVCGRQRACAVHCQ